MAILFALLARVGKNQNKEMPMSGNVQELASEGQTDELRITVIRAFDKLRGRLGGAIAQGWIGNSSAVDQIMERLLAPVGEVAEKATVSAKEVARKLLQIIKSFKVAGAKKFVANEHFKKDTSDKAKVKISWLGDEFKKNFLGLTEENVPEADLKSQKLLRGSRDPWIIVELGENYTVSLAHVWNAMMLQPKGEEGNLLTNGWANIFYVADVNGVVWAVRVDWRGGGWNVDAYSVEDQLGWHAGYQVLSR